ncbi:MAG: DUF3431 domain-containing protein [Spartobacteria bacterium]|nr:DUF3431 domain-containing protein [Spartobacteria bacterium]
MFNEVCLVVAKYREDVSWVRRLGFQAIIYDKSGLQENFPLPNIGRETHTYLYHILHFYPKFPEYTVFLQGNPFDHLCAGMTTESLYNLIKIEISKKVKFKGLSCYSIRCDELGRPHQLACKGGKWSGFLNDIPVGRVYGQLFSGPIPSSFHCRAPAGLFLVHSSRILCRPKSFYEKAMEIILCDKDDIMNTGHAFERLWYIIFNGYKKLNKDNSIV